MYYTKAILKQVSVKNYDSPLYLSIYLNVQNRFTGLKILIIFCISFFSKDLHAQLGFCQGNSGDPIFTETFGTGLQDSPLPAGATTYTYANGAPPNDGLYTVSSNTDYFDWFDITDITPNDTNGRMLVVNSDFDAGEFYRTNINGLCGNTTYEFSSWLINLSPAGGFCGSGVIPINVNFEIWDSTDTNLLASGSTGSIGSTSIPDWNQFGLVFQTQTNQTAIILKMINNGVGGCGNDLAIDDIVFKSCGDSITVEDANAENTISICSSQTPFSATITAIPDNAVFSSHFYQWESSTNGVTWQDIAGETNAMLNITDVTVSTLYRARIAEFEANLNDSDCITFSDVFQITVNPAPPMPDLECWETATFDETICDWVVSGTQPEAPTDLECWETTTFDETICAWIVTGTQPEAPTDIECWEVATFDNTICDWVVSGTQPEAPTEIECWETIMFNNNTCLWEVLGEQPEEPIDLLCWQMAVFNFDTCIWDIVGEQPLEFRDEFISICDDNDEVILEAISDIENPSYNWSTGAITQAIIVDQPVSYTHLTLPTKA